VNRYKRKCNVLGLSCVDKNTPLSHSHGGKSLVSGDRKQCTKLSEDNEIRVLFHWDGKLYCSCYKYSMGMSKYYTERI